jgi:hypothetical protein
MVSCILDTDLRGGLTTIIGGLDVVAADAWWVTIP